MSLDKKVLANALALSTAVLWTLCSFIVWLFPSFSLLVTKWWMHGMSMNGMGEYKISLENYTLGGITMVGSAWVTGYIIEWSLSFFGKKGKK